MRKSFDALAEVVRSFLGRDPLSGEAADKPLPPREEPGWFRRFMNMFGF